MNENKNGFYDNDKISRIDSKIKAHLARPTLVSDLKKQNAKKREENKTGLDWGTEWNHYWYVYVFLFISALFTGTLGIYMGLSPTLVTEADGVRYIHFNTDVGHVILAVVYFIAFLGVTEIAFAIAKWKYFTREENNGKQTGTMITAMAIAGLSILLTGIAGGMVVASNISFLSEFVNIPPAAQKYIVVVIPILIMAYTVLFSVYALASDTAASERIMQQQERERELDNKTRMNAIRQIAAENLQAAQIEVFEKKVQEGLLSAAEALAAIEAGRSLKQEEVHLGRDLDGDGVVGVSAAVKARTPSPVSNTLAQSNVPGAPDDYGPQWKNSTDITPTLDAYAWVCLKCEGSNHPYTRKCQWCGQPRTNESPVTAFSGLPPVTRKNGANP